MFHFNTINSMKKVVSMIVVLVSSLAISCSNDFINILPTSSVSVDILYKTDKDFKDALTATYSVFQDLYQNFYVFGDIRGDDSWMQIYKNNSPSYSDLFTITSSDGVKNRHGKIIIPLFIGQIQS